MQELRKKKIFEWSRTYNIHIRTLQAAAQSPETLKLYSFYLNIHSLYYQKIILNYKSRYQWLSQQTGVKDRELRKYINTLIKHKICWYSDNSEHLVIGTPLKFAQFLDIVEDYYYDDFEEIFHKTKFIRLAKLESISKYDLEAYVIQLGLEQKAFALIKKEVIPRFGGKQTMSKRFFIESKIKEYLANNSGDKFNLFLNDIKMMFNLKSNQAASYKIKILKEKGLLAISKQYKYIKQLYNKSNSRLSNKQFIKNGWIIEQLPNKISVIDKPYEKNWWYQTIEDFYALSQQIKGYKIKNKVKDSNKFLTNKVYNKRALQECRRMFKNTYVCSETGEVLHEHIFIKIRDLVIKGWKVKLKHLTPFKVFDRYIKYQIIEEELGLA